MRPAAPLWHESLHHLQPELEHTGYDEGQGEEESPGHHALERARQQVHPEEDTR